VKYGSPRYLLILMLLLSTPLAVSAQQAYIGRIDFYSGSAFLQSPHISLAERGYHLQAGVNMKTWYAMGFDYSIATGNLTLTPDMVTDTVHSQLTGMLTQLALAGKLPASYQLAIPTSSTTQTFAAGPQLNFRQLRQMTFFHPSVSGRDS
jgi:hypothetical protein